MFVSILLAIDITSDNCLNSIVIGRERPEVIEIKVSNELPVFKVRIKMARHHVVPYHLLRQFFNTIVIHGTRTLQDRLYSLLASLGARVLHFDIPEFHETVYERRMEILRSVNNIPIDFDLRAYRALGSHIQIMHQLFAWMPFNVFEGPISEFRRDDPGSHFETNCREVIGELLFSNLQLVHAAILEYGRPPHNPAFGEKILQLLEESLNHQSRHFTMSQENWFLTFIRIDDQRRITEEVQGHLQQAPNTPESVLVARFELRTPENRRLQMERENVYFNISPDNTYDCSFIIPISTLVLHRSIGNTMTITPALSEPNHKPVGSCYVQFIFPSTVPDDPVCLISLNRTIERIKNKTLLFEYGANHIQNKIWDLKELQLLATNELVESVDAFKSSEYASWKEWFQKEQFNQSGNLLFEDKSFVIEYFMPCINSTKSDCSGVTIFDSEKRPIAKLRRENKTIFMYLQGKWQQTEIGNYYTWENYADDSVPRFNVRKRMAVDNVRKRMLDDLCNAPSISAVAVGGALSGAAVGSVVPIIGTGAGATAGTIIGLIAGTIAFPDCK